jgi:hypothetical protein
MASARRAYPSSMKQCSYCASFHREGQCVINTSIEDKFSLEVSRYQRTEEYREATGETYERWVKDGEETIESWGGRSWRIPNNRKVTVTKTKFGYRDGDKVYIRHYWIGDDGIRYPPPETKRTIEEVRKMPMAQYVKQRPALVAAKLVDKPTPSGYTRLDPPWWFNAGSWEATVRIWRDLGWEIPVEEAVMFNPKAKRGPKLEMRRRFA